MEHSKSSVTNAHALLPPPSSQQQQPQCDCPDSFASSSGGSSSHIQPQQQQQQDKRRRKNADATNVDEASTNKIEDDVDWEGLALQQQEYIKSMKKREKRQQKQEQEQQYPNDNTAQPPQQEQDEEHQNQNHDTNSNTKNLRHGNTVPTPMERWDALLPEDSPQLSQHKLDTQFIAAPAIGMDKVKTTQQQQQQQGTTATGNDNNNNNNMDHRYTFSTDPNMNTNQRTRYFIPRMEYVNRTEFMESPLGQQLGVPVDPNTPKDNDRVLFLYSEGNAYPTGVTSNPFQLHTNPQLAQQYRQQRAQLEDAQGNIPVDVATENCDLVHVVLTNPDRHKQCIAIVGQYESYHVHRYMRMPPPIIQPNGVPKPQPLNASFPLRSVQRGMQVGGRPSQNTPRTNFITKNWELLLKYKTNLTAILQQQLQPLLQSITNNTTNNTTNNDDDKDSSTVIVMVCNFGQSELLMNCKFGCWNFCYLFVCVCFWVHVPLFFSLVFLRNGHSVATDRVVFYRSPVISCLFLSRIIYCSSCTHHIISSKFINYKSFVMPVPKDLIVYYRKLSYLPPTSKHTTWHPRWALPVFIRKKYLRKCPKLPPKNTPMTSSGC